MAVEPKETPRVPAAREERRLRLLEPWSFFDDFDLDDGFARFWRRPLLSRLFPRPYQMAEATSWTPRLDELESNGQLVVRAELPGMDKKDIKVSIDDGDLVIEGQRKSEKEVKEEHYYRMERMTGTFYRRLPLPEGVKSDQIQAEYKDGVLEVRMPKAAPAQPAQQIAIK